MINQRLNQVPDTKQELWHSYTAAFVRMLVGKIQTSVLEFKRGCECQNFANVYHYGLFCHLCLLKGGLFKPLAAWDTKWPP